MISGCPIYPLQNTSDTLDKVRHFPEESPERLEPPIRSNDLLRVPDPLLHMVLSVDRKHPQICQSIRDLNFLRRSWDI